MAERSSRCAAAIAAVLAVTACANDSATTGAADTTMATTEAARPSTIAEVATSTSVATVGSTAPSAVSCTATAPAPTTVAYNQAEGVEPDRLSVDVYPLPVECGPAPVLFWVHGGGWRRGDKTNRMRDKATLAARNGWVLVSVNYRLSTPGAGVTWPTHGNDVNEAVTFVLDRAESYGIDAERVALMGHSAGAHLASIVTVDPDYSRTRIDCLVSIDTEGYDLNSKMDSDEGQLKAAVTNAFGSDADVLADASPTVVLRGNPGQVADAMVITRGTATRQRISNEFVAAIRDTGAEVTVVVADGYSHADVNDAIGTDDTVVAQPVEQFLEECLDDAA